jgi:hypothetical protein
VTWQYQKYVIYAALRNRYCHVVCDCRLQDLRTGQKPGRRASNNEAGLTGEKMSNFSRVGLEALLTPDNCALVLIDHQPFQLANVNSHEPTMVINNVTALAKTAKTFNIPTILTTVTEERGGRIFKSVQDVFQIKKRLTARLSMHGKTTESSKR